MTQLRKSDAQLDAEAAAPARNLADTILLHRALCARETSGLYRLHQRDGDFGIGVPFSHQFEAFLDGSSKAGTYGWSAGAFALHRECRRTHSEHWQIEGWTGPDPDPWRGSLCTRLVYQLIPLEKDYEETCRFLHVDPQRTERVAMRGFAVIESALLWIEAKSAETAHSDKGRHDWMAPEHVHHAVPGAHMAECPQCIRGAVA